MSKSINSGIIIESMNEEKIMKALLKISNLKISK